MPKRTDYYFTAQRHALRALLRGDLNATIQWTNTMTQLVAVIRHVNDLQNNRCRPKPKFRPPKPLPTLPVMLDPAGYSPGGEPNWVLNQRRLERAGLKEWPKGAKRFT